MKLIIIISFLLPFEIVACRCGNSSLFENFNYSDLVFLGKVIDTRDSTIESINGPYPVTKFVFETNEIFKGEKSSTFSIIYGWSNCNIRFKTNCTYLVFSDFDEGFYSSGICSATKLITNPNDLRLKKTRRYSLGDTLNNFEDEQFGISVLIEENEIDTKIFRRSKKVRDINILNKIYAKVSKYLETQTDCCNSYNPQVFFENEKYHIRVINDSLLNVCSSFILLDTNFNLIKYVSIESNNSDCNACADLK